MLYIKNKTTTTKNSTFKKWRSWHLGPITAWQVDGETVETVTNFIFLGCKITANGDYSHEIRRYLLLGRKAMTNPDSILKRCYFADKDLSAAAAAKSLQSCPTLCDLLNHSPPGLPVQHQLPEFTKTHVHRVSDAIQPSYPLTSPSLPARNPSQHQGLFQWVNSSHEVAKLLTFQLYHQSFKWTPRPDPFRMDWLDLLAVQRTLKSLLQHHSAKASILWCPAFFTI